MRTLSLCLVSLLTLLGSCSKGTDANAASNSSPAVADATKAAGEITTLLSEVKDVEGAKKAVEKLGPVVTNFGSFLEKIKSAAGGEAGKTAEGLKGMAGDAAKKVSGMLSPELASAFGKVTEQITRISANAEMLAPLKDVFEKLKGFMAK